MMDTLQTALANLAEASAIEDRLNKSETRSIVSPRVSALTAIASAYALIEVAHALDDIAESLRKPRRRR